MPTSSPPSGRFGRVLLTIVGLTTSLSAYVADWNETHIYNPAWTPHAKFHNGQTMSMGLLLGLCSLYYLYKPARVSRRLDSDGKALGLEWEKEARRGNLSTAVLFGSLYWLTQLSAFCYPGALAVDPPGQGAPQLYISGVVLLSTLAGWKLELDSLKA